MGSITVSRVPNDVIMPIKKRAGAQDAQEASKRRSSLNKTFYPPQSSGAADASSAGERYRECPRGGKDVVSGTAAHHDHVGPLLPAHRACSCGASAAPRKARCVRGSSK